MEAHDPGQSRALSVVSRAIGQLVPRHLRRNCSKENKKELSGKHEDESGKGLYPTGLSPFKIDSNVASGTGSNQIKNESSEMHHVQGHKPSPFLSATALDEDALNPKGKSFGQVMTVVIDLSHIEPVHITALYTSKAISPGATSGWARRSGKPCSTSSAPPRS